MTVPEHITPAVERDRRYMAMLDEAERQGLAVGPPYATKAQRSAWQSGYRDALRDIASGKVKPR